MNQSRYSVLWHVKCLKIPDLITGQSGYFVKVTALKECSCSCWQKDIWDNVRKVSRQRIVLNSIWGWFNSSKIMLVAKGIWIIQFTIFNIILWDILETKWHCVKLLKQFWKLFSLFFETICIIIHLNSRYCFPILDFR